MIGVANELYEYIKQNNDYSGENTIKVATYGIKISLAIIVICIIYKLYISIIDFFEVFVMKEKIGHIIDVLTVLGAIGAVLMICGVIFVIFWFKGDIYSTYTKYTSPNNHYKVAVKGSGAFFFGSENIKIYAYNNNIIGLFKKEIYKTTIANDGKSLHYDNFLIEWINDNTAYLTLKGEEQSDEKLMITFGNKIVIKKVYGMETE